MGRFFNIFPNLSQNLRNQIKEIFWKNPVILFKIWRKICPIGIWMDHFFWKNWYLYESTFKFSCGTSLPKPNLSAPSDYRSALGLLRKRIWFQCCFSPQIPLNLLNSPLFRVRGVDVVRFGEKKSCPRIVYRYQRGNLVVNEDVAFPRWPPWEFSMV